MLEPAPEPSNEGGEQVAGETGYQSIRIDTVVSRRLDAGLHSSLINAHQIGFSFIQSTTEPFGIQGI